MCLPYLQTRAILLLPIHPALLALIPILTFLIPLFAELVLVVRFVAVYRPARLVPLARVGVYAPICLMKLGRLVNFIMFTMQWVATVRKDPDDFLQSDQAAMRGPYAKIEWLLMLLDTS